MIVVTIGTNEQPFDRLVAAASRLRVDEELVVQYGSSSITAGPGTWVDFLDFDALADLMARARVVVCHAGVGSIMLARRQGRRPIVVPRRLVHDEAVDDHQLPLARRLAANDLVTLVEDEALLQAAILAHDEHAPSGARDEFPGVASLVDELRRGLDRAGVLTGAASR